MVSVWIQMAGRFPLWVGMKSREGQRKPRLPPSAKEPRDEKSRLKMPIQILSALGGPTSPRGAGSRRPFPAHRGSCDGEEQKQRGGGFRDGGDLWRGGWISSNQTVNGVLLAGFQYHGTRQRSD